MSASFRDRIRKFLQKGEGAEEFVQLLLRMIFSNKGQSPAFRRTLAGYYGPLNPRSVEEEVIPELIEILFEKRDMFLSKEKLEMTFCIVTLRNAILDRIPKKKREKEVFGNFPVTGRGDEAEEAEVRDENSAGEGEFVQKFAAQELVQSWDTALSDRELRTFCDYLYREYGNRNDGNFLGNISKEARYQQVTRLKKRLKMLNEQSPDYKMFRDREIWHLAFLLFQSEICPGLRLYGVNDIGSTDE